jgi:hypothetical protein
VHADLAALVEVQVDAHAEALPPAWEPNRAAGSAREAPSMSCLRVNMEPGMKWMRGGAPPRIHPGVCNSAFCDVAHAFC